MFKDSVWLPWSFQIAIRLLDSILNPSIIPFVIQVNLSLTAHSLEEKRQEKHTSVWAMSGTAYIIGMKLIINRHSTETCTWMVV